MRLAEKKLHLPVPEADAATQKINYLKNENKNESLFMLYSINKDTRKLFTQCS